MHDRFGAVMAAFFNVGSGHSHDPLVVKVVIGAAVVASLLATLLRGKRR